MSGDTTFDLPPVSCHWHARPTEMESPAIIALWLTDWAQRFPYDTFWSGFASVEQWNTDRPDAPEPLRTGSATGGPLKGYTITPPGRIYLNHRYEVREVLAHELGHQAQHWAKVLPAGHPESDAPGDLMHRMFVALPDGDGEEDFATRFGRQLTGTADAFMRWFPLVLQRWRARWPHIYDAHYYGAGFIWWDGGLHRWERCEAGRLQWWDGQVWQEVQP